MNECKRTTPQHLKLSFKNTAWKTTAAPTAVSTELINEDKQESVNTIYTV